MRKNRWLIGAFCGVLAVAGAAVPLLLTASSSHASTPAPPDTVQYVQSKQTSQEQFNAGGDPKAAGSFTQPLTGGGGGCSAPTVNNPVLAFGASFYPSGYGAPSQPGSVGAYQGRTGVCAVAPDWAVNNLEGLIFEVGPNAAVAGRDFARAQIVLEREDKGSEMLMGNVVLRLKNAQGIETQVASYGFQIGTGSGTQTVADTQALAAPAMAPIFDEVEIQNTDTNGGLLSVVGPTNTFTMESQLCAGSQVFANVNPGDDPNLSKVNIIASGSGCKPYSAFTATGATGTSKIIDFAAQGGSAGEMFTAVFDWGDVAYCTPPASGATTSPPAPRTCPPTLISFDNGLTRQPETFCPGGANPPNTPPWCAVDVKYSFDNINGTNYTHIVEDWSGKGPDPRGYCC
jgi:hypothetical protein